MPIVRVTLIEGRGEEAKTRLVGELTDAVARSLGAPRESIRILLEEIPAAHWAVGGVQRSQRAEGET